MSLDVCIATLHTPNIAHWAERTAADKRAYAARHGYAIEVATDTLDATRPPSWSKLPLIRRLLAAHEWVAWFDADTVFTDHALRLETWIDARAGGPDFIVGADPVSSINCGAFFARATPATMDLIDRVWDATAFVGNPWWEQAALWDLIKRGRTGAARIAIVDRKPWNVFPHEWKPGDFAIHFAGRTDRTEMVEIFLAAAAERAALV